MKTSRLLTGLGAVALAATSVAANAGTRAVDAPAATVQPVKLSAVSGEVSRSAVTSENEAEIGGPGLIIAIIAGIAIIVGIVIAASDGNDLSPGA